MVSRDLGSLLFSSVPLSNIMKSHLQRLKHILVVRFCFLLIFLNHVHARQAEEVSVRGDRHSFLK